jgi:hypothetical protein
MTLGWLSIAKLRIPVKIGIVRDCGGGASVCGPFQIVGFFEGTVLPRLLALSTETGLKPVLTHHDFSVDLDSYEPRRIVTSHY